MVFACVTSFRLYHERWSSCCCSKEEHVCQWLSSFGHVVFSKVSSRECRCMKDLLTTSQHKCQFLSINPKNINHATGIIKIGKWCAKGEEKFEIINVQSKLVTLGIMSKEKNLESL